MHNISEKNAYGPHVYTYLLDGRLDGRREERTRCYYESPNNIYSVVKLPNGETLYFINDHKAHRVTVFHREAEKRFNL